VIEESINIAEDQDLAQETEAKVIDKAIKDSIVKHNLEQKS
jgi:hypothetical protein